MRIRSFLCCLILLVSVSAAWAADKDTLVVAAPSDIHTLDPGVSSDNYDWRQ
jgi:peptide/nickel transport system substrate-binding protein